MLPLTRGHRAGRGPYALSEAEAAQQPFAKQWQVRHPRPPRRALRAEATPLVAQDVAAYYTSPINLERPRPGQPAADATLDKWLKATRRLVGYVIHVEGRKQAPSLEPLLDGSLLSRYVAFLFDTRCALAAV